jgi:chemotaxis protein MotB
VAKKEREDEVPAGAPDWIVTFSDMVSLLVTFFVMLLSFSTDSPVDNIPNPGIQIGGTRGAIDSERGPDVVAPQIDLVAATDARRGAAIPHARPEDELSENLAEMGVEANEDAIEVDFRKALDGVLVQFDSESSFSPSSATVPPALTERLRELAQILEHYQHLVIVEGFTDSAFEPTAGYPSKESLSIARARAATEIMLRDSALPPELVQIAGLGDARPRQSNDTAHGRRLNRRVEIRILNLSTARAALLEKRRVEEREGR